MTPARAGRCREDDAWSDEPARARFCRARPSACSAPASSGGCSRSRRGAWAIACTPSRRIATTPTGQVADAEVDGGYDDLDALRRVRARRRRRDLRVRERAVRERRGDRRAGAGPAGRLRAAHHAAPRARERVPVAGGPAGHAVRARSTAATISTRRVDAARLSRRAEDRQLRLRRQGPGDASIGADDAAGGVGAAWTPAGGARGVRRLRARALGRRGARRRTARSRTTASSRTRTPGTSSTSRCAGARAAAGRARRAWRIASRDARSARRRRRAVRRDVPHARRPRCSSTSSRRAPHNSGHLTIDACVTSQFEQQLRAVCGLPLGSTDLAAAGGDGEPARRPLAATASPTGPPRCVVPASSCTSTASASRAPAARWATSPALADSPDDAAALVREARAALTGSHVRA